MICKRSLMMALAALAGVMADTTGSESTADITAGESVPALGKSIDVNFQDGESPYFHGYLSTDTISYGAENGLDLEIKERLNNPAVKSDFHIMFGRVEAVVKAAAGKGIVSSVFLQSEDGDEIDWEWTGGDPYHVQSNFFSKGHLGSYDRGGIHDISNPFADFQTYTLDWTLEGTTFYVNGESVRFLPNNTDQGYPQSPMAVFISLWAGGDPSNPPGTIEWAGGVTDYSELPFNMYVKSIKVADYSSGTEYVYKDTTGSWTEIEAVNGEINGRVGQADDYSDTDPVSSSSSEVSSTTESSSTTSTEESSTITSETSTSETSTSETSTSETSTAETTTSSETTSSEPTSSTESTSSSESSSSTSVRSTITIPKSTPASTSSIETSSTAAPEPSTSVSSKEEASTSSVSSEKPTVTSSPTTSAEKTTTAATSSPTTLVTSTTKSSSASTSSVPTITDTVNAAANSFYQTTGLGCAFALAVAALL